MPERLSRTRMSNAHAVVSGPVTMFSMANGKSEWSS